MGGGGGQKYRVGDQTRVQKIEPASKKGGGGKKRRAYIQYSTVATT